MRINERPGRMVGSMHLENGRRAASQMGMDTVKITEWEPGSRRMFFAGFLLGLISVLVFFLRFLPAPQIFGLLRWLREPSIYRPPMIESGGTGDGIVIDHSIDVLLVGGGIGFILCYWAWRREEPDEGE